MKKRKITFEFGIADYFDNSGKWPVGSPDFKSLSVDLEFDWDEESDIMRAAEQTLDRYVKENHKNKKYKIYYWWWKN